MNSKKGFLLAEETLKIIIALISISFLVYFLGSLYFSNQNSKELEQAKASLEFLINEVNDGRLEVTIYNPKGWVITSWPHKTLKGTIGFRNEVNDKPNSCSNIGWTDCICICKDTKVLNLEGSDCDNSGICEQSDYKIQLDSIKIDNSPITLSIKDKVISIK